MDFWDNVRQLLYVICLTGLFTAFIMMIRWAILAAYGPAGALHEEDGGHEG